MEQIKIKGEKKSDKRKFDDLDKEILIRLNADARRSYREIASELRVSVGTVHNRIQRLIKSNVLIGVQPILNVKALGYENCFIFFVTIRPNQSQEVFDLLKNHPSVQAIYRTTGEQSAILICRFKRMEGARDFISEITQNQAFEKVISHFVLDVVKENMNLDIKQIFEG